MRKLLLFCVAFCVLFVVANSSFAADETTVRGWVADSKCAALKNGADANKATPDQLKKMAECQRKCVKEGAKVVVVTDDDKVLTVDNPETLAGHAMQHVQVTGHVTRKSLHVDKVQML